MLLELEDPASESSRCVEHCVAIQESAIAERQEHLTLRHDASIEIGDAFVG